MRKLPLVLIEWDDITTCPGWTSDSGDYAERVSHCTSIGWKLNSTRKHLVITPMRDNWGKCDDVQIIPRGCIKSIRRIE